MFKPKYRFTYDEIRIIVMALVELKEINVVAWNGGKPKIDVRDWNSAHDRMSRGITLTEDQAKKMTMALVDRYRNMANREQPAPMRDDYAR